MHWCLAIIINPGADLPPRGTVLPSESIHRRAKRSRHPRSHGHSRSTSRDALARPSDTGEAATVGDASSQSETLATVPIPSSSDAVSSGVAVAGDPPPSALPPTCVGINDIATTTPANTGSASALVDIRPTHKVGRMRHAVPAPTSTLSTKDDSEVELRSPLSQEVIVDVNDAGSDEIPPPPSQTNIHSSIKAKPVAAVPANPGLRGCVINGVNFSGVNVNANDAVAADTDSDSTESDNPRWRLVSLQQQSQQTRRATRARKGLTSALPAARLSSGTAARCAAVEPGGEHGDSEASTTSSTSSADDEECLIPVAAPGAADMIGTLPDDTHVKVTPCSLVDLRRPASDAPKPICSSSDIMPPLPDSSLVVVEDADPLNEAASLRGTQVGGGRISEACGMSAGGSGGSRGARPAKHNQEELVTDKIEDSDETHAVAGTASGAAPQGPDPLAIPTPPPESPTSTTATGTSRSVATARVRRIRRRWSKRKAAPIIIRSCRSSQVAVTNGGSRNNSSDGSGGVENAKGTAASSESSSSPTSSSSSGSSESDVDVKKKAARAPLPVATVVATRQTRGRRAAPIPSPAASPLPSPSPPRASIARRRPRQQATASPPAARANSSPLCQPRGHGQRTHPCDPTTLAASGVREASSPRDSINLDPEDGTRSPDNTPARSDMSPSTRPPHATPAPLPLTEKPQQPHGLPAPAVLQQVARAGALIDLDASPKESDIEIELPRQPPPVVSSHLLQVSPVPEVEHPASPPHISPLSGPSPAITVPSSAPLGPTEVHTPSSPPRRDVVVVSDNEDEAQLAKRRRCILTATDDEDVSTPPMIPPAAEAVPAAAAIESSTQERSSIMEAPAAPPSAASMPSQSDPSPPPPHPPPLGGDGVAGLAREAANQGAAHVVSSHEQPGDDAPDALFELNEDTLVTDAALAGVPEGIKRPATPSTMQPKRSRAKAEIAGAADQDAGAPRVFRRTRAPKSAALRMAHDAAHPGDTEADAAGPAQRDIAGAKAPATIGGVSMSTRSKTRHDGQTSEKSEKSDDDAPATGADTRKRSGDGAGARRSADRPSRRAFAAQHRRVSSRRRAVDGADNIGLAAPADEAQRSPRGTASAPSGSRASSERAATTADMPSDEASDDSGPAVASASSASASASGPAVPAAAGEDSQPLAGPSADEGDEEGTAHQPTRVVWPHPAIVFVDSLGLNKTSSVRAAQLLRRFLTAEWYAKMTLAQHREERLYTPLSCPLIAALVCAGGLSLSPPSLQRTVAESGGQHRNRTNWGTHRSAYALHARSTCAVCHCLAIED